MKDLFKRIIVAILEIEARLILRKYKPRIIAVTGSVGKTSAKDAIYAVLADSEHVRKSEKSFNSEIGIPLTILGRPNAWNSVVGWVKNIVSGIDLILFRQPYPKVLVLEIGADRPGDIEKTGKWLSPDIVVVTWIGELPVHVEFFDSPEAIFREKAFLVKALKPNGVLILNGDDERTSALSEMTEASVVTYGIDNDTHIRASLIHAFYKRGKRVKTPAGVQCKVKTENTISQLRITGTIGRGYVYTALAGFTVGIVRGLSSEHITDALGSLTTTRGRMRLVEGMNGTTIIDDTYNSSPVAVSEALNTLKTTEVSGRRIAVIGDMMELGAYSVEAHKAVGRLAVKSCDVLVTVGLRAQTIARIANEAGMSEASIYVADDEADAGEFIESTIDKGDLVLIKGSQSVRLEKVVKKIMLHPEDAPDLLVRQDDAWKVR
ncbi:hypothetical protein COB55_03320 [Candidatus Wolfebacteria bacterium]|nr:MAG: hypothetical protein COB55_03320 [Candidatus Wolfebacteria bacterium]